MGPRLIALDVLLRKGFSAREQLLGQLEGLAVTPVGDDGSLLLQPSRGEPAQVEQRIPVEAEYLDEDGVVVHVLLHVVDGFLRELEVYREDGRPVHTAACDAELNVKVFSVDWDGR